MNNRLWPRLAAAITSVLLSACGNDMSDLQRYVAEVKARKSVDIETLPQLKQYEAYAYVAEGRRDPFVSSPSERERAGGDLAALRPDLNRNKEPLEEFPLDALRLVGIVRFGPKTYAMVRAPDSVIHRVSIGDHMGQNYGRINKVSEAEVALTEIIPDGFGGFLERPAALAATE